MGLKIGDQIRPQPMLGPLLDNSATAIGATLWGLPFSMQKSNDFAAVANIRELSTLMARVPYVGKLCVGTTTFASPTAYATVAGSSFSLCASGATQTQLDYARIGMSGSCTNMNAQTIIIDGTTISLSLLATDTSIVVQVLAGCSLVAAKLTTCIKGRCTYLDATYVQYGDTTGPVHINIWPRDGNRTFNITSTSIMIGASADAIGVQVGSRSAMMEFKTDNVRQIMSTVSTLAYTHGAIKLTGVGSCVANVSGFMLFGNERYKPNISIQRGQLATVSSAYSS